MDEFKDKVKEIQDKVRTKGIVINRIPNKTKKDFIAIATEEFAGDYGLLMKWCLEQALEYQSMKVNFFENMNYKLDNILEIISQNEQTEKPEEKNKIKLLSGKQIQVKGGNKK